ncbi:MAG: urea ABC transporter ATP-binding subunit UrtE [Acetobacteraceae bacterium]|nr:urea ABC transporter ATP-binding subunit UrtE [Acetobacteraceae bacterium]
MSAHLSIDGLDVHYGSARILRGVSMAMEEGQCLALLGRNGAGKTTLLRCLVGLLAPSAGRITLSGADIVGWPSFRRTRAGLGYVPQGREIFADLSVAENLLITQKAHGIRDPAWLDEVCALFPVLRQMWRRRGGDLSGGQQQQLAICRALMGRPRLLVLDEPTEGIQPSVVKSIESVIASLKGSLSILLVEQYFDFARQLADRFVVLDRGAVAASGTADEMDRDRLARFLSV